MYLVHAADFLKKAQDFHNQGNYKEAEIMYNEMLSKDHKNPWILYLLGSLYSHIEYYGLGAILLSQADRYMPKKYKEAKIAILNNLGICYKMEFNNDEAERIWNRALRLNPNDGDIRSNIAAIYTDVGDPYKSINLANKALKANPDSSSAKWNKCIGLLQLDKWAEAWPLCGNRPLRDDRSGYGIPNWDGTKGKNVIVHGEQGLGDEIMFSSCIPDLKRDCNQVYIECEPRLEGLFHRSFNIPVYGTHDTTGAFWKGKHEIDYKISFMELCKFYRNSKCEFSGNAYLVASSELRKEYRKRLDLLGSKAKIGIAWQGGIQKTRIHLRSLIIDQLKPILDNDCDFISLQYTQGAAEDAARMGITHWPEAACPARELSSYDRTAALIAELDIVITVCMTVVHAAGGLGKECWVMCPSKPSWRYGIEGKTIPWYNSVKIYRQKDKEDWDRVVNDISKDLKKFLEK